ncbi:MAG: tRNA lysidine(34) synthetase TilS [Cyanobacteriota bacterium]
MILPSDAERPTRRWGPDQDTLHRHLLRHPTLLPKGAHLLVACSGGQDSMAMTGLLRDLRPLHGWRLSLWHGDHGWRPESAAQAGELASWADGQGLVLHRQRACPVPASEAAARDWRYHCLGLQAVASGCGHVVTAHTATDRAETLLLNLARGTHRRGLGALRPSRCLVEGVRLVRPLLPFSREDTARICLEQGLPVWLDGSNSDPRFSRNRLRAEVLPVLEALHPGATTRIAAMAERLAQDGEGELELIDLALQSLSVGTGEGAPWLDRRALVALQPANQRRVLREWLWRCGGQSPRAVVLEQLVARLPLHRGPGRQDLAQGWHLRWDGRRLTLFPPLLPDANHAGPP